MRDTASLEDGSTKSSLGESTGVEDVDYLQLTRRAYKSSTDYMSSNLRRQWERNINNFLSRHPPGSKYNTDAYKHRSRLFRPKTRASIRNKEAALAIAFFSTSDVLSLSASDQSNPEAVDSAKTMQEIVNLRLKKSIKWFPLVIAAFQDANIIGTVVSHQYWDYEEIIHEETEEVEEYVPEIGNLGLVEKPTQRREVISDKPVVELVENENFRIDAGASWIDPINTSPYIIHLIPMYIVDILDRMERTDPKTGQPAWKPYSIAEIIASRTTESHDSTRLAREKDRQDPKDPGTTSNIDVHQIVWVFRNIFRLPGKGDYIWYTLGHHKMLTEPVPLKEVYLHGKRPYAMGHSIIEAHRNYPSGSGELGQDIQAGANDLMNQRFDNVKQVLNKRFFVRRGATVDLRSLRRNVPGSITMMGDVEKDVKEKETTDVTGSSYKEQPLFDSDFDDITGNFSAGSVQTNKQLGETVGGMRMLKEPSNILTEYMIRVFAETWVKEVITQLVDLEKEYETDEFVITAAGKAAKIDKVPDNIMDTNFDIEVNVGFGVTDPQSRIAKVLFGIEAVAKVSPKEIQRMKGEEIVKEVFGILGYQDGSRFFMNDDEFAKYQEENPPPPNEIQLKIESQERIEAARLGLQEMVEAEKILSAERIEAAKLSVAIGDTVSTKEFNALGQSLEMEKVGIEKFKALVGEKKVEYDREDSLRKDAEIRDKEKPKTDRSGGD